MSTFVGKYFQSQWEIISKIDSFLVGMKVGHPGSTMAVNFGIPSLKNETKDLSHNMSKGL